MDSRLKGFIYEKYVKNHILSNLNKKAYLWNETPATILIKNNIIGSHNEHRIMRKNRLNDKENPIMDTGIDIVQIDNEDDLCSIIQCKNGYSKGVSISNLAILN